MGKDAWNDIYCCDRATSDRWGMFILAVLRIDSNMIQVVDKLGLSYKNVHELNRIIDQCIPHWPRFQRHDLKIGSELAIMYSQDLMECIQALYSNPEFATHLIHKPKRHYQLSGKQ